MKKCLTIAKDLLDKFNGFRQAANSFSDKIKSAQKWTAELDEDIIKYAVKRGHDVKIINLIKQNGGLREFYEKNLNALSEVQYGLQDEIKTLEKLQSKSASAQFQNEPMFVKASAKKIVAVKIRWGCVALFVAAGATSPLAATLVGAVVPATLNAAGFACLAT